MRDKKVDREIQLTKLGNIVYMVILFALLVAAFGVGLANSPYGG